jgi:hypothetical protein
LRVNYIRLDFKMAYVYIDYSGEWSDKTQSKIVLPALVCSKNKLRYAKSHIEELKLKLESWGIDTKSTDFEFHAHPMFTRSGIWGVLSEGNVSEIADDLRNVILALQLPLALILVDKDAQGKNSVKKFKEYIKAEADRELKLLSEDQKRLMNQELNRLVGKRGTGPLGYTSSLLFGLTSSLMDIQGYPGNAQVIIGKSDLVNMQFWELLFKLSRICMPSLLQLTEFPNWPEGRKPRWRLGGTIEEGESKDELGLQLADFIAYTTAHLGKGDLAAQKAVINQDKLRVFGDYPGISFCAISYKRSWKVTSRVAGTRKGRHWLIMRGE